MFTERWSGSTVREHYRTSQTSPTSAGASFERGPAFVHSADSGETGTEKELLARAIHQNSPRRHKPFVTINCGAVPKDLIEAELFGFKRGAFTGAVVAKAGRIETADGGTLFLDEIGELPPLRERKGGVPELIQHLFRVMKERHGLLLLTLDAAVTSRLCAYRWPGNVRELENVIERMIVLCSGNQIAVNDLPDEMVGALPKRTHF